MPPVEVRDIASIVSNTQGRHSLLQGHIIPKLEGPQKAIHEKVSVSFLAVSPGPVMGRRGQPQKRGHTFPGLEGPEEPIGIRGSAISITWKGLSSCRREGAGSPGLSCQGMLATAEGAHEEGSTAQVTRHPTSL